MRKFVADELRAYLAAVDAVLDVPITIVLVGSANLLLHYDPDSDIVTDDIDTFNKITEPLTRAMRIATEQTGIQLPLRPAVVAQAPEAFEDRLIDVPVGDGLLTVAAMERHDFAISKILRCLDRDREHIMELHEVAPLELGPLVDRFTTEMLPLYVGNPDEIIEQFAWVVEDLWGELAAKRIRQTLKSN